MDAVVQAFNEVDRRNFVPKNLQNQAEVDAPLPIGFGQTISQPTTVRLMLGWLNAKPGEKILDVGSGSGWTTALLSQIVGPKGQVCAVEKIPQLVDFGRSNCGRVGVQNAKFFHAGKGYGLSKHAPYDRILVSASAQKLPVELISQLKVGGKLVIPVRNDILEIIKISNSDHKTKTHPGFVFVPLV